MFALRFSQRIKSNCAHPKVITWIREFLVIYSMNLTIITFNYLGLCSWCMATLWMNPRIYIPSNNPYDRIVSATKLCVVHNWIWVSVFRCIQLQYSVTKINHIRWLFRSEFEIYRSALRFSVIIFNRKPEQITKINIYHININGCIHFSLDRAYTYVNVSSVCVCLPPRARVCVRIIYSKCSICLSLQSSFLLNFVDALRVLFRLNAIQK